MRNNPTAGGELVPMYLGVGHIRLHAHLCVQGNTMATGYEYWHLEAVLPTQSTVAHSVLVHYSYYREYT